ncbi:MAG: polyprenyl synthetase family protein, partial [Candidatus Methanomethylophilaceae archaeon]|nr:polyprenyl synthetase family protein [Candidatus Methanomethylophilaceae archaeon]
MAAVWTDSIKDDIDTIEDFILDTIHSDCEELDEMCRYVIQSGGKRVRPIVCLLTYLALGGQDKQRAISVGSAFEIVHSATLIHDDINDGGEFRRGRRTLHREYTLTKAIVAGDYLLTRGYKAIGNNLSEEAMAIVAKAAAAMSEGEFMQQDLERDVNVTEAEYFKIINGKTAVLINAAAMAGALLVSRDRELLSIIDEYAIKIGLAFQIIDDTLDVVGSDKTGKKVGIDMTEGKPTLPVIYAIEDPKYGKEIAGLFARKDLSDG